MADEENILNEYNLVSLKELTLFAECLLITAEDDNERVRHVTKNRSRCFYAVKWQYHGDKIMTRIKI